MNTECLDYALAKQLPLGGEKIILDTDYGRLSLDGRAGRLVVKAIRLILMSELKRTQKKQGGAL